MTGYMLDTNAVSDLVRNPTGRVAERIGRVGEAQACTSIIVAAELRYGAARKGSSRLSAQVDGVLARLTVLAFEAPADETYGVIRAELEAAGRTIGANDLLIAAHALSLSLTLVTDNERGFARVAGLRCENWTRS